MNLNPSADDVAVAVIAACGATGESPLGIATEKTMRTRHYAMHALAYLYPKYPKRKLAKLLGCQGHPDRFWNNSRANVANPLDPRARTVSWWSSETYWRVIRAVQAASTARAVAPYRPPAGTIEKVLADDGTPPIRELGKLEAGGYRPPEGTLEKVLAEAAANTAKAQARDA
jgi:hypothetical protein